MVVSICPSTEDSLHGTLFSGDVGTLLDNILAAIGLKPEQTHKTAWVKTAPVFTALPDAEHIRSELAEMQNELATSQARAVLFLGKIFDSPDMIGLMNELCAERPHFVIPHPARLLMQPQLKAQAWQILKPLKQLLAKPSEHSVQPEIRFFTNKKGRVRHALMFINIPPNARKAGPLSVYWRALSHAPPQVPPHKPDGPTRPQAQKRVPY